MIQQTFPARFRGPFSFCSPCFSQLSGPNYLKFGENVYRLIIRMNDLDPPYAAPFTNHSDWSQKSRPNCGLFSHPYKN